MTRNAYISSSRSIPKTELSETRNCNVIPSRREIISSGAALCAFAALGAPFVSRAAAQESSSLKFSMTTSPPDPACHAYYYARDAGFFKKNQVNVTITEISSGANVTRAVVSGEAEVGWVDGVSSLQAKQAGAPIMGIGTFSPLLDYQIIGRNDISNMAGLSGRKFAIASIGGSTYTIPKVMIEREGGKPSTVGWVSVGNSSARAQALVAGSIDATIVTTSYMPRLLSYKNLHLIANAGDALPHFVYAWDVANNQTLSKKREAIAAFKKSVSEAVIWAYAKPDDAVEISLALLPNAPKHETEAAIRNLINRKYWSTDGKIYPETFKFTVATLIESKQLDKPLTYNDFVDNV
jgi:NitT/TauT family transport system substrate-binding protein